MDAKGAALPDDSIEEESGLLRDLVVGYEELLKFINDEENAWHRAELRVTVGQIAIASDVLDAEFSKPVSPNLQFLIESLHHG